MVLGKTRDLWGKAGEAGGLLVFPEGKKGGGNAIFSFGFKIKLQGTLGREGRKRSSLY